MFSISNLLLFLGASLTLSLLPGPDMIFILSQSITCNRQAGILATLGITTGLFIHTLAAACGISVLILKTPYALTALKVLGAIYLCYMGFAMLFRAKKFDMHVPVVTARTSIFRQGLLVNLLNPKVVIFFLAFIPQFIDQSQQNLIYQFIIFGLFFILIGTSTNLTVAYLGSFARNLITTNHRILFLQEKFSGLILIIFGCMLGFFSR